MNEIALRENLCRRFCSYYKASQAAEPGCRGFIIVRQLSEDGRDLPFDAERRRSGPATEELLRERVCASCEYREQDCDFAERREDAPPCGGFLFLCRVVEDGVLSVDDMPQKL